MVLSFLQLVYLSQDLVKVFCLCLISFLIYNSSLSFYCLFFVVVKETGSYSYVHYKNLYFNCIFMVLFNMHFSVYFLKTDSEITLKFESCLSRTIYGWYCVYILFHHIRRWMSVWVFFFFVTLSLRCSDEVIMIPSL